MNKKLKEALKEDLHTSLGIPKTLITFLEGFGQALDELHIKIFDEIRIYIGEREFLRLINRGYVEKAITTAVVCDAMCETNEKKWKVFYG